MAPIKTALKSAGTAQRQRNPMLTLSLSREDARHGDEIDSKFMFGNARKASSKSHGLSYHLWPEVRANLRNPRNSILTAVKFIDIL